MINAQVLIIQFGEEHEAPERYNQPTQSSADQ